MNISILTEHSLWWLLPIFILAASITFIQYFYKSRYKNDLSVVRIFVLSVLRFLAYCSLLFLLLNPSIKYSRKHIEKPLLIWAQDNSQSIKFSKDSSYFQNEYSKVVDNFLESLSSKYDVQKLSFGQNVKPVEELDFSEPSSDYASLLNYLKDNVQAGDQTQVILAGDGLYNKGNDPRFSVQEIKTPIHTIILGDVATQKDLSIVSVRSNKLAFLKSNMPVRVALKADSCSGETFRIQVLSGSEILYQDTLNISRDDFFVEKDFFISPSRVGLQKYELKVQVLEGEVNAKNNVRELIVDVLDRKRKIAICFDAYHPDIAAIQSALQEKSNDAISLIDVSKKQVNFSDFNMLVLYQLPSNNGMNDNFFNQLKSSASPFLMILGGETDINHLNQLNLGLNVIRDNELFQDASLGFSPDFSIFELNQITEKNLSGFPPLLSPMAKFQFNQESNIMGTQIIKGIPTEIPLIVFSQKDQQKQCYVLGEGLWRWKLHDYKLNSSHEHFNTLINQIVQYLALRVKKSQLSLQYDKLYKETDAIQIGAQLYNKSYQATNTTDIKFLLRNEKGNEFAYQFERSANVYQLDLNNLPAGKYEFEAKAEAFDKEFIRNGSFVISSENSEAKELQASPALLKNLSELSTGMHFSLAQLSLLSDSLLNNAHVKSRLSIENSYSLVLNFIWILCFVILLLVLEWFLRKHWLGI